MKRIGLAALALLGAISVAGAARAETSKDVCILASNVEGTTVVDNRTILYRMNDGTVWRNTLKAECPHLSFDRSFSQVIRGDMICANKQVITVVQTGIPCQLGDFTKEPRHKD